MADDVVLLTGVSGFIAKHVALQLLDAGYRVRGTVRSMEKGEKTRASLEAAGADVSRLSFVEADLTRDAGWDRAVSGCRFVCHTASPFPGVQPKDKFALVPAARGGTVRVLEAAKSEGVERVVLTSSVVSVYLGHGEKREKPFDETDWTNVDSDAAYPYAVSKTLAERAAWECLAESSTELATINPSLVLGPLVDRESGTSVRLVSMMIKGRMPVVPDVAFGIVDVRDVAQAHVAALRAPGAAGRRFIVSGGTRSLMEVARTLREREPDLGGRVPRVTLPDWAVRLAGRFSSQMTPVVSELGKRKTFDTSPARDRLGIRFRDPEEAVAATARSLRAFGLV